MVTSAQVGITSGSSRPSQQRPPVWRMGVRSLVGFVHRQGDLGGQGNDPVLPGEGLRAQQRWQASQGEAYQSEVFVRGCWQTPDGALELGGRMDGLWQQGELWWVDEVKAYRGEWAQVRQERQVLALAQAKVYAALWATQQQLPAMGIRLVHVDADSGRAVLDSCVFARAELEAFLRQTCTDMLDWLGPLAEVRRQRDGALEQLAFPKAEMRPAQQELSATAGRCAGTGGQTVLEAPTGTGKTLAVLYGALRKLASGRPARLLYLTARTSGRHVAWQELSLLSKGAPLRVVNLQAQTELCLRPDTPCRPEHCPFARDYYSHRRKALAELLRVTQPQCPSLIERDWTRDVARRFGICPVRLQQDAARWSDVVIMDLNQAFDPLVRQRALLDRQEGESALLIDEAHNLEDRLQSMYSAGLEVVELERHLLLARQHGLPWSSLLGHCIDLSRQPSAQADSLVIRRLQAVVSPLLQSLQDWLAHRASPGQLHGRVRELARQMTRFLAATAALQQQPRDHVLLQRGGEVADAGTKIRCVAPGNLWQQQLQRVGGTLMFSATLPPDAHLREVLALPEQARMHRLAPPFDHRRQCAMVVADIDMGARRRDDNLARLACVIKDLVQARPGHYLVFVPAFAYLHSLAGLLACRLPEVELLQQTPAMDEAARADYLERLRQVDGRSRVALAVAGGIFGEGIDLPGAALIGVVVAGVPVPAPDAERQALQARHGDNGLTAAFHVPAMQRVRQAAGRLLRTPEDSGVLCLVDRRFMLAHYASQLPEAWRAERLGRHQVAARAQAFWSRVAEH